MVRVGMIGGLSAIALLGSLIWPPAASAQIKCVNGDCTIPTWEEVLKRCNDKSRSPAEIQEECSPATLARANASMHFKRATDYLLGSKASDLPLAIAELDQSILLNPANGGAYQMRALAKRHLTPPDFVGAMADVGEALRLTPENAEAYALRGECYLYGPSRDFAHAIADFTRTLELDKFHLDALRGRGYAHLTSPQPDYERAYADYNSLVSQHTSEGLDYYRRGVANLSRSRPDLAQAISDFDMIIRNNAQFHEAYVSRGDARVMNGEYLLAITDYDKAIQIRPVIEVAYKRGKAKASLKDYPGAIEDFEQVRTLLPEDPVLLNTSCWNRALWGQQLDQALADCNASLRIRPNNPDTLNSRGLVKLRRGDFEGARTDYLVAVKTAPNDADSWFGAGIASQRLGQAADAKANIAKAQSIDPNVAARFVEIGLRPAP